MIGDNSFKIKPRLGDYVLLNRNQGHLAKTTLFPCPHPVLGKGEYFGNLFMVELFCPFSSTPWRLFVWSGPDLSFALSKFAFF